MDPVIVVGAGISGVRCARTLHDHGVPVVLLDRGYRIGGRMATKRIDGRTVDLGASYFTVSDSRFGDQIERWQRAGLAHPWTDTIAVLAPDEEPQQKPGPMRWGTPGGLRTLVEDLAEGLDVRRHEVAEVTRTSGLRVDAMPAAAVVLAMPDGQAARLLGAGLESTAGDLDRGSEPVLALVATYAERAWDFDGAFVNGDPDLAWIADDGSRRGDAALVLVAHSTPELAARHLDDPDGAEPHLLSALRRLGIEADPVSSQVKRWSMARPTGERDARYLLTEDDLGVCGDGWGPQSKVEGAYLSGLALGEALVARL
ncbi:NAD(P)/FAD-dependent oxidoreductase [Nocardioides salsibiostraticola]